MAFHGLPLSFVVTLVTEHRLLATGGFSFSFLRDIHPLDLGQEQ
jgi:hypothetical protein